MTAGPHLPPLTTTTTPTLENHIEPTPTPTFLWGVGWWWGRPESGEIFPPPSKDAGGPNV